MSRLTKALIHNAYRTYEASQADARLTRYHQQQISKSNQRIETGTIKFVHPSDGYGFVTADRDGADIWIAPNAMPQAVSLKVTTCVSAVAQATTNPERLWRLRCFRRMRVEQKWSQLPLPARVLLVALSLTGMLVLVEVLFHFSN
jgi:hypothetical protein